MNFASKDIFPVNSVGVVTGRDEFVIDMDKHTLEAKVRTLTDSRNDDEFIRTSYQLKDKPASKWSLAKAREVIKKTPNIENYFTKILYRPFDERWIFYHPALIERSREEVMRHMMKENLAIVSTRQNADSFHHALVADTILESCYVSNKTKEIGYLYSDTYRQTYQEFLKSDFPRVPFTTDHKLFQSMAVLGKELADLHLLKSSGLDTPTVKFHGTNDHVFMERRDYNEKTKQVRINDTQYFDGIAPDAWHYYIGGYQVLDKLLKDRKARALSSEDIKHYCRVATAITKTIAIQKQIDELYPEVEKTLI